MKRSLLQWLCCPECGAALTVLSGNAPTVDQGMLRCANGHQYPIRQGIPRFVARRHREDALDHTQRMFGHEWATFADYDVENFHTVVWPTAVQDFPGMLGLDAGVGAGRHMRAALRAGAEMVGVDVSTAVDVAYQHVGDVARVHLLQADLQTLPLRPAIFDFIYSWGVLQHTVDPAGVFRRLVDLLKPGRTLVVGVYQATWRKRLLEIPRHITKHLPPPALRAVAYGCACVDYYGCILPFRLLRRRLPPAVLRLLPSHIREYAKYPFRISEADWFDRLGAPITHAYTREQIESWYAAAGLEHVRVESIEDFWWRGVGTRPEHPEEPRHTATMVAAPAIIKRILVIDLAGIGDLVLATPALHALRQRYPDSHIAVLVASHAAGLLEHCPWVDAQRVLASTRAGVRWWAHLARDVRTLRQLRAESFDVAINLYAIHSWWGSARMAYYLRHIHARETAGYDTDGKGWCFSLRVPETREQAMRMHETQHALQLLHVLGCSGQHTAPTVWVTDEERHRARQRLATWGIRADAPWMVMSPGAHLARKRWPAASFATLGRWFIHHCGGRIVLVGDSSDDRLTQRIAYALGHQAIDVAGRTSLRELLALLSWAPLVVTNDTGTMHMTAALARPLVAVFGPTSRVRFGPQGSTEHQRIVPSPTRSLRDLPVADVQRAVEDLMRAPMR